VLKPLSPCAAKRHLTPIDSNWNLAEAATSSFAVSWELKVWVRLPHASANLLMIRLPLLGPETENRDTIPGVDETCSLGTVGCHDPDHFSNC
jgi:hypothetical protein